MSRNKIIATAHEIFYGGDRFVGKAGSVVGSTIRATLKFSAIAVLLLVVVVVGQMTQYIKAVDSVREAFLSGWAGRDATRLEQVADYRKGCHGPLDEFMEELPKRIVSLHECAEVAGSKAVADVLRAADKAVEPVAPMSWF